MTPQNVSNSGDTSNGEVSKKSHWLIWLLSGLVVLFVIIIIILRGLCSDVWYIRMFGLNDRWCPSTEMGRRTGLITGSEIAGETITYQNLSQPIQQFITTTQQKLEQINITQPGPQGLQGSNGAPGIQGETGPTGPTGPAGSSTGIVQNELSSAGNNLTSTVNGVASNVGSLINTNTTSLTQSGGLVNTINGVAATQLIPSGTATQLLGFTGGGSATYQSVANVLAGNTSNGLSWTQGTSTLTSTVNGVASSAVLTCPTTTTFICQNGNSFAGTVTIGSNDANSLAFETNNTTQATIASGGAVNFQNSANSTTAFRIQNAAGSNTLFTADTTNGRVTISSGTSITSPGSGSNSEKFGLSASVGSFNNSLAVGEAASVGCDNSVAIGRNATATCLVAAGGSIAIGSSANAPRDGDIAIGWGSGTASNGAIFIGTNNTRVGGADNAYVIGKGNNGRSSSIIIGQSNSQSNNAGSILIGRSNTSPGTDNIAIGFNNTSSAHVFGSNNNFSGSQSYAIGYNNASSNGNFLSAYGSNNTFTAATPTGSAIYGNSNSISGAGSNTYNGAFGLSNTIDTTLNGNNCGCSYTFGRSNSITDDGAVLGATDAFVVGASNIVTKRATFVVGNNITNNITNTMQLGMSDAGKLTLDTNGSLDIGGATSPTNKLTVTDNGTTSVARFNSGAQQCTVVAGTGWSCTSDISLKTNIVNISEIGVLAKLGALQPVTYQWKDQYDAWLAGGSVGPAPSTQYGFVAQQVETVLPEVVETDPQTGLKMINYGKLNTFMITALKENYGSIQAFQSTFDLTAPGAVTINRNIIASGSLQVDGTSTFNDTEVHNALATFNDNVHFLGTANFDGVTNMNGRLQLSNNNTGSTVITAGNTSVHVNFPSNFSATPNVNLTPGGPITGNYWVSNITTSGFDINFTQSQASNTTVYWQAF